MNGSDLKRGIRHLMQRPVNTPRSHTVANTIWTLCVRPVATCTKLLRSRLWCLYLRLESAVFSNDAGNKKAPDAIQVTSKATQIQKYSTTLFIINLYTVSVLFKNCLIWQQQQCSDRKRVSSPQRCYHTAKQATRINFQVQNTHKAAKQQRKSDYNCNLTPQSSVPFNKLSC